eukprot:jgi/Mesvir1/27389/Mv07193-RA.1
MEKFRMGIDESAALRMSSIVHAATGNSQAGGAMAAKAAQPVLAETAALRDNASCQQSATLGLDAVQEADLSHGLTFYQHMFAGAVAGVVEHTLMFPVDTIKTRMQAVAMNGSASVVGRQSILPQMSMFAAMTNVIRNEGAKGLYRGISAMGLGAGPAHAVYFATYESAKEMLGGNRPGHHPLVYGAAGAAATFCEDAVFTPMDVVKQRLQVGNSPYKGIFDCIRRTYASEGFAAFYRSFPTRLLMNIPFTSVHFTTYESSKLFLANVLGHEDDNEEKLVTHLVAGGSAGALAGAVTTPLDVLKTRLQTQGVAVEAGASSSLQQLSSLSVFKGMQHLVREEGFAALWRGLTPRVVFYTPAAAICWGTYEYMKSAITSRVKERGDR